MSVKFAEDRKAEVLIKDRDKNVEKLRIALAMSGLNLSYHYTDLLNEVMKKIDDPEFNIGDAHDIRFDWETKWLKYHEKE